MKTSRLPVIAIAVSALLWGMWWIPLRWLGEMGFAPLPLNALLYGAGALVLLPFLLARGGLRRRPPHVLASGIALGFALIAWNLALLHGEVVRVTLLFYLSAVWASLMEWVVLHRRIRLARVVAVLLGLGGAWVLLGDGGGPPVPRSIGDWFGIISGLLFAIAVTVANVTKTLDSAEQTCVAFAAAAIIGFAATFAQFGGLPSSDVTPYAYGAVIGLAVVWLLPISLLLFWGARSLPPGRVSLLMLLGVVPAVLSATYLAVEPFTQIEAVGCALIIASGLIEGVFPDRAELEPLA